MAEWHPWRELRRRDHLVLGFAVLPDELGGSVYWPRGGRAAVIIDPRLPQRERRAALAHELVHDERGGGCDADCMPPAWDAVVAREEGRVAAEVARRLVPDDELRAFLRRLTESELGGATARDIADHFDVPEEVASTAARLLGHWGGPE